eukprot:789422-Amphidinium_carterae.1
MAVAARCSCANTATPSGNSASLQEVARMQTRCRPRTSGCASPIVESGCSSHGCSFCKRTPPFLALMESPPIARALSSEARATEALARCSISTRSSTCTRGFASIGRVA